jgi:surfeit locus 1 family protein
VGLAITGALGTWQVQRLTWKEGILARISEAEQGPPLPFTLTPPDFTRMRAEGRFAPGAVRYAIEVRNTPQGQLIGSRVIEPLRLSTGGTVLVDRGWAPDAMEVATPEGEVSVVGYARPSEKGGWLTPADDLKERHFYAPMPRKMAEALGVGQVAPFLLVALGRDDPDVFPQPAESLPRPPNDHLQYAITWYGLGLVLLVMFLVRFRPFKARGGAA